MGGPNSKEEPPSWYPSPIALPTFCPIGPPFHALINNRHAVSEEDDEVDAVTAGQHNTDIHSSTTVI